jgi:hypothetical protein
MGGIIPGAVCTVPWNGTSFRMMENGRRTRLARDHGVLRKPLCTMGLRAGRVGERVG